MGIKLSSALVPHKAGPTCHPVPQMLLVSTLPADYATGVSLSVKSPFKTASVHEVQNLRHLRMRIRF